MSTTFTLTGTNSVLSHKLYPPVVLDDESEYVLGLINFGTCNSFANVDVTNIVYCISRVENERFRNRIFNTWYTRYFSDDHKKTLIFGIPSNFKYYSTELWTKHTLVAMVTITVCNHFIAHRLEGI
jgi:hypothetical protein